MRIAHPTHIHTLGFHAILRTVDWGDPGTSTHRVIIYVGVRKFTPIYASSGTIIPMIDWSTCLAVEQDPNRVSGAWVFRHTRVPIAAMFENLEDGAQISQFVEWFPGVTLEQARAVLEHAARSSLTIAA